MAEFVSDLKGKKMRKEENAVYQHLLLFPHCLQKASFPGLVGEGLKN